MSKFVGGKKDFMPENLLQTNRFELIFDELVDAKPLRGGKKDLGHFFISEFSDIDEESELSDS